MKKILFLLALAMLVPASLNVNAEQTTVETKTVTKYSPVQADVTRVGTKILKANGIKERMNFDTHIGSSPYAIPGGGQYQIFDASQHSINNDKQIYSFREINFDRNLLGYISSEDELAAVLAHEIAHGVDSYRGFGDGFFRYFIDDYFFFMAKKTDTRMDQKAVDYMVKAGYNPKALITINEKARGEKRADWYLRTNKTSKKIENIREYIKANYPSKL